MKMQDAIFLFSILAKFLPKILVLPYTAAVTTLTICRRINQNKTKLKNLVVSFLEAPKLVLFEKNCLFGLYLHIYKHF